VPVEEPSTASQEAVGIAANNRTIRVDHLVGEGEQLIQHMDAKHFGDLAIDHELEVYLASS
jgi:hypothetical protein